MTGEIILGSILSLPLILGLVFRVSTSHIFFSLMAGDLLGRYFGHDIETHTQSMAQQANQPSYGTILLITLPMILTAIFLKGTITKGKAILHILPLAVTGIIFAAFALPALPPGLQQEVRALNAGEWLLHLNKVIIGGMVAIQLVALWLLSRGEHGHKHEHHSKK